MTDERVAPITDCLRLIIQLNRRLDELRKLSAPDAKSGEEDDSMFILAESAQENLRDVRRDILRIRIILESLPDPVPTSASA